MSKTQADVILFALNQGNGLCAMWPLRWTPPITRVAARIYDLRRRGHVIDALQRCPVHDGAAHAFYKLVPPQDRLF